MHILGGWMGHIICTGWVGTLHALGGWEWGTLHVLGGWGTLHALGGWVGGVGGIHS